MFGGLSPASGESMLTGSPPSGSYQSPMNNLAASSASPKTPFLPAYLLGHQSTPTENYQRNYQNYPHPHQQQHQNPNHLNASMTSPGGHHHHVTWSPDLIQRIPTTPSSSINRFGGPPIRSLEVPDGQQRKDQTYGIPLERLDSSHLTSPPSNLSAAQVDPFYTQGEDFDPSADLDESWVTVFGFPSDAADYILKEFATYGTVIQHQFASKGNWVHIRYQSPMQAKRAMAKNGHLYAQNTIRVGVSQCIDKDIMRRYRRKNVLSDPVDTNSAKRMKPSTSGSKISKPDTIPISSLLFSHTSTSTPIRPNQLSNLSLRFDTSIQNGSASLDLNRSARLGTMRPLAGAYDFGRPVQEMENGTSEGLLSKAWKFIFNQ